MCEQCVPTILAQVMSTHPPIFTYPFTHFGSSVYPVRPHVLFAPWPYAASAGLRAGSPRGGGEQVRQGCAVFTDADGDNGRVHAFASVADAFQRPGSTAPSRWPLGTW